MVYDDAEKYYAEIAATGQELLEEAFGVLFPKSIPIALDRPIRSMDKGSILGYNCLPTPRMDVVKIPMAGSGALRLRSEAVQITKDGSSGYLLMDSPNGTGLATTRGLFADVQPATGDRCQRSSIINRLTLSLQLVATKLGYSS